ncbi:hypothetical protein [Nocardia brasiliensis]|uniref:hypothetical protein n=1 Tax=Nocardia brasiliensis TaxID=37326 RepID=UPI0024573C8C|nr:hypothetical protein [Nocardia brasiliensis]
MTDNQIDANPFELAGWRARLLDRIEDLAARYAFVLHTEYPGYREGDGRGAAAIERWRGRLRDLEDGRTDLEIRAELTGMDIEFIELARQGGEQGERWNDLIGRPPTVAHDDPARAPLLDAIAETIWTLEHMAAVEAARQRAGRDLAPEPASQQQYERNMTALWTGVNTLAAAAVLTEAEHTEMLHRDHGNWIRMVSRTVYGYTDSRLAVRWRAYAWPGIEWEATRVSAEFVGVDELTEPSRRAPAPDALISEATRALHVDIAEARADAFIYGGDVLDHLDPVLVRSLESAGTESWGSEPAGESLSRPTEFGTSTDPV